MFRVVMNKSDSGVIAFIYFVHFWFVCLGLL